MVIWVDVGPHARGLFTTRANRAIGQDLLGAPVAYADQVHGADVLGPEQMGGSADAVLGTDRGAGVLVADCVPVLLAGPGMVAAVHAGRRGLLAGVVQRTLTAMAGHGHRPTYAAIGPAICGHCYEVPADMRAEAAAQHPVLAARTRWGTPSIDLPGGVGAILTGAGIDHVVRVEVCTYEDDRFYSYRREGTTGRFAGLIAPSAATRRDDLP